MTRASPSLKRQNAHGTSQIPMEATSRHGQWWLGEFLDNLRDEPSTSCGKRRSPPPTRAARPSTATARAVCTP